MRTTLFWSSLSNIWKYKINLWRNLHLSISTVRLTERCGQMAKLMWEKQAKVLELSWNPTTPLALLVKRSSLWARELLFNVLGLPKSLEITITWFISRTTWSTFLYWAQSTRYIKVDLNTPDFLCLPEVLYNYTVEGCCGEFWSNLFFLISAC